MKKKIIFLIIGIFFIIPTKIKAEDYYWCDLKDLNYMKSLATNITTSYSYQENIQNNVGNAVFSVKVSNLHNEYYLKNVNTNEIYYAREGELVINNVSPNTKIELEVYANLYGCNGNYLTTIYVNIPPYNKYYTDKVCEGFENYKLCNKWTNVNITYEQFVNTVKTYKKKSPKKIDEKLSFSQKVLQVLIFLNKYRFKIIVPIIILTGLGIIIIKIKEQKDLFDFKLK